MLTNCSKVISGFSSILVPVAWRSLWNGLSGWPQLPSLSPSTSPICCPWSTPRLSPPHTFSLALLWAWNAPAPGLVVYCSLGNKDFLKIEVCVCVLSHFSHVCLFCDPVDCSPPGSSVHGILQARILEWGAMPPSRGSSWPRDRTHVSYVSCTGRRIFATSATWEAQLIFSVVLISAEPQSDLVILTYTHIYIFFFKKCVLFHHHLS